MRIISIYLNMLLILMAPIMLRKDTQAVPTHMRIFEEMFRLTTDHILRLAPLLLPLSYHTPARDRVKCAGGCVLFCVVWSIPTA